MEEKEYDLAVSFAGEQRDYVVATVRACQAAGLKVFYDKNKNNTWWGGNFIQEQRARSTVPERADSYRSFRQSI